MNKTLDNALKWVIRAFFLVFLLAIGYTFIRGLTTTLKMPIEGWYDFEKKIYFFAYFLVVGILVLVFFLSKKIIKKRTLLIIMYVLVAVTLIYGLLLPFSITNIDSYQIYKYAQIAQKMNFNELSIYLSNNNYFMVYPHQFGMFLLNYILIFIFQGGFETVYTILNIVSVYTISTSLFFVTDKLYNSNRANLIYVILQSLFIMPAISINYHYAWQIGLALSSLSLLFFVKYKQEAKNSDLIISLLMLILAVFLKPNYIILGLAFICYELIQLISKISGRKLMLLVLICISTFIASSGSRIMYNVVTNTSYKGVPQIAYLAMGLQESDLGNGWFNGYHTMLFDKYDGDSTLIKEEASTFVLNTIRDYANNPVSAVHFFKDKWDSFMLMKDYQFHAYYSWAFNKIPILHNEIADNVIYTINNVSFLLNMLGCIVALVMLIKKPELNSISNLIIITFMGACLYHLLFETKGIYIYPWVNLCLPVMAFGLNALLNFKQSEEIA